MVQFSAFRATCTSSLESAITLSPDLGLAAEELVARLDSRGRPVTTWGDDGIVWGSKDTAWISMAVGVERGVLAIGRFEGYDTYDEGAVLPNGDLVVAGNLLLVRYERR